LFTLFTRASGVPSRDEATEFYVLVSGALIGMCLMVSANHMMIVFLGIEMASVPSYALAGLLRHRRASSEAALKFAVFGGGTAGVMLYGISLLVGVLGSAHLPTMATQLAGLLAAPAMADRYAVLALGGLMVMVGLAFKLSAVPFHFWAPDVFEGATAEVGALLSVASKVAAVGLLVRLVLGLGYAPTARDLIALEPVRVYAAGLVGLLAAITCTFGNLAAYGQTNMKRFLAYSTIAHAGYMMMPVAAAATLLGADPPAARQAVAAVAFYGAVYLFMNLGAFAVVAVLRNALGSEEMADYAGLVRRSPGLVIAFAVILFSLVGLPPLAGFSAKFAIFSALLGGPSGGFDPRLLALLIVGVLNTVLSLFYYLRVVKVMILEPEPASRPAPEIPVGSVPGLVCVALSAPLVLLFVWPDGLLGWAAAAARTLF
jgi:NADH-quinone oxidoreductase subunit N